MNYTMYNSENDYGKVDESVINDAVKELEQNKTEFIVLEAQNPVAFNAYIQTAGEDGSFILETRFVYNEKNYRHYIKEHLDIQEVKKALLDYIKGIIPDVNSSGWEILDI